MVTVGFDLDLTLVDSRPGIAAMFRLLAAESGVAIDVPQVLARIGRPLAVELAHWFPAPDVPAWVDRYRELYGDHAVEVSPALPGAAAALAAIRAGGGSVVVVTAKHAPHARRHLDHLGLVADAVVGGCFGPGKSEAIAAHGVQVYVGDHVADMASAAAAGVPAVGVTTGGHGAEELRAAGAAAVLDGLGALPAWLGRR